MFKINVHLHRSSKGLVQKTIYAEIKLTVNDTQEATDFLYTISGRWPKAKGKNEYLTFELIQTEEVNTIEISQP